MTQIVKQSFIKFNETIHDYSVYIKNVVVLKHYVRNKLKDLMKEEGFKIKQISNDKYHSCLLKFYNEANDIEVQVCIRKKNKEIFV